MSLKRNTWKPLMALGLILGFAIMLTLQASAKGVTSPLITGIQVANARDKVMVHVTATGEVQYRVLNLSEPRHQLVVEVFPAQLAVGVPRAYAVNKGVIEKVRVGQFSDEQNIVRVVVDLNAETRYQIATAAGRKGLMMAVGSMAVASAKAPKADVPMARASMTVASLPPVAAPPVVPSTRVRTQFTPADDDSSSEVKTIRVVGSRPAEVAQRGRRHRRSSGGVARYGRVNLDFVNADLIYVLKLLAKEMGVNLVTDQTVKGSVTMSLKNVPADVALSMILKISGFEVKRIDYNTIVVGSKETVEKFSERIQPIAGSGDIQILPIPLENAKAATVADTIKSVYPGVTVTVQADQNFVVVKGSKTQLRDIKEFVQKLDVPPPPPVVLKTEIIPIKYATAQTLLQLAKSLHPGLSYTLEDRLNSLIVTGQDRDIDALKAFLATVDIPLQQVMLDVKMVSLSEAATKSLGFTIGSSQGTFGTFGAASGPIVFTEAANPSRIVNGAINNLAIAGFLRSPVALGASLQLAIQQTDGKVIASPRLVTQSGKEAQALIGEKFPVVYFDPRAGQFQVQYVDIGVKLVVKPTVASDGNVLMDLNPTVSTLLGLVNNQYPRTSETSVKTTVRVKDGDTFIIGGLLRELENVSINKLPFLGDLPVLGEFFRNSSVNKSRDEVFIMITPRILQ